MFPYLDGSSARELRLIQAMTAMPQITPTTAPVDLLRLVKAPNKNMPSIPPLNMEASFHQASRADFTLIIASATDIASIVWSL